MTACRSSALAILGLLLAIAQTSPSAAQTRGPIRLIPLEPSAGSQQPPPASTTPTAPSVTAPGTQPATPPGEPGAVEVGKLKAYDPSSVGLLYEGQGGFPVTLWRGTERATVAQLLPQVGPSQSAALQSLARRLLLSAANVPQGNAVGPSLLALRVQRLLAIGDNKDAADLARQASTQLNDAALNRAAVDAFWLTGSDQAACTRVAGAMRGDRDQPWLLDNAFCRAVKGDREAANISAGLLREQQLGDPAFFTILSALTGDPDGKLGGLPNPTPLKLAMLRAAKLSVPDDILNDAAPEIVTAVAGLDRAPPTTRLVAAERAATFGNLPAADLGKLYAAVSFKPEQLANAPSAARDNPGPLGNALLYQAVLAQQLPLAKAEALKLAMAQWVDGGGTFVAAARLYGREFASLQPEATLAWFAVDAGRALVAVGNVAAAHAWGDLAQSQAAPDRPDAAEPAARLAVLLQLADPAATTPLPIATLKTWMEAMGQGVGAEQRAARATFLFTLLDGLDQPVPGELWQTLYGQGGISAVAMPSPALRQGLQAAADAGRLGETVLLALLNLGDGGPLAADASTLSRVMHALRKVGLDADARAIAVEAALAHEF